MKNIIKIILSIFLLSFTSQNANAAVVKPIVLQENVRDTTGLEQKQAIKPKKERVDVSQYIMQGSLLLGGMFLVWGIAESNTPCPVTNTYVNLCFNGLGKLVLGGVLICFGALLAFFRHLTFLALKNKKILQKSTKK